MTLETPLYVNEQEVRGLLVTTTEVTTDKMVEVFAVGPSGVASLVGWNDTGAAASTQYEISCEWALDPGTYTLQIVMDRETASPKTLFPDDEDEDIYVIVRRIQGLDYVAP